MSTDQFSQLLRLVRRGGAVILLNISHASSQDHDSIVLGKLFDLEVSSSKTTVENFSSVVELWGQHSALPDNKISPGVLESHALMALRPAVEFISGTLLCATSMPTPTFLDAVYGRNSKATEFKGTQFFNLVDSRRQFGMPRLACLSWRISLLPREGDSNCVEFRTFLEKGKVDETALSRKINTVLALDAELVEMIDRWIGFLEVADEKEKGRLAGVLDLLHFQHLWLFICSMNSGIICQGQDFENFKLIGHWKQSNLSREKPNQEWTRALLPFDVDNSAHTEGWALVAEVTDDGEIKDFFLRVICP